MNEILINYFPELSEKQLLQFENAGKLYKEWNEKINVISRKDIENLFLHHFLHSLAISRFIHFKPGTKVLDLGTGGGFPGIPLAIFFPEVRFTLIDGTQKKITVVKSLAEALELENVVAKAVRAEELKDKFDFVVTRAVAKVDQLLLWSRHLIQQHHKNIYPNGLIALKGDLKDELKLIPKYYYCETVPILKYFNEPYFEGKFILYVQG